MMRPSTIAAETLVGSAKGFLAASQSCLAAFNDHQGDDAARGSTRRAVRRLPHGHVGHVGVRVNLKDRASAFSNSVLTSLLNWRRFWPASFSRIQIGGILPRRRRVSRVLTLLPIAWGTRHNVSAAGANRTCAHTLRDQHSFQYVADTPHSLNRLSSSHSSRWIDPNENGLTHEARSLSPDDKIYD